MLTTRPRQGGETVRAQRADSGVKQPAIGPRNSATASRVERSRHAKLLRKRSTRDAWNPVMRIVRSHKGGRVRLIVLLISGLVMATVIAFAIFRFGCVLSPLSFSEEGDPRGTGVRKYSYSSGATMRTDDYRCGKVVKSTWYTPDGMVLFITVWGPGPTGTEYYLREDGTVRRIASFLDGKMHGISINFSSDGRPNQLEYYEHGTRMTTAASVDD